MICTRCKKEKSEDELYIRKDTKKGVRSHCRECKRDKVYWFRYKITLEDYNKMFEEQGKACKICKTTEYRGKGKHMHVDHCHKTGKVRGILCNICNRALSLIESAGLDNIIEYFKGIKR